MLVMALLVKATAWASLALGVTLCLVSARVSAPARAIMAWAQLWDISSMQYCIEKQTAQHKPCMSCNLCSKTRRIPPGHNSRTHSRCIST